MLLSAGLTQASIIVLLFPPSESKRMITVKIRHNLAAFTKYNLYVTNDDVKWPDIKDSIKVRALIAKFRNPNWRNQNRLFVRNPHMLQADNKKDLQL